MERIVNIIAAIICIISVLFNLGYYFGISNTVSNNFNDRLAKLENESGKTQETVKNLDIQLSYIRGYLSKQVYKNTQANFNVDQAIKASSEINLSPRQFNHLFSTINLMPTSAAKKYLKENTKFSDDQINAILKVNKP